MVWRPDRHSSHAEAAKIKHLIVPYTRGRVLDVGSGPNRVFPHFTTLDSGKDFGGRRVADIVADGDDLTMLGNHAFDAVFSSHFLEHVVDYKAALAEWWRVIRTGGHLVLYLPHKNFYPNIGQVGANPDHKHDFLPYQITKAMEKIGHDADAGWVLVEDEERNEGDEYSFLQVYRKEGRGFDSSRSAYRRDKIDSPTCLVIRYGAYGDQLISGSVAKGLKAQGYHVTWNCTPRGFEVLQHNPHIDAFMVQDEDQVPNHELGDYFAALRREGRWDKIINLCESIEGSLLPVPSKVAYDYPIEARRKLFGSVNYLERAHDIAGVPYDFDQRFYPSEDETAWAKAERAKIDGPLVMWALAGSSVHKAYPWTDQVAGAVLAASDAHLLFVGDKDCQELELAVTDVIDKLPPQQQAPMFARVHRRSGVWSIRQSFAFVTAGLLPTDIIVGPETGTMNAAAFGPARKILMLSHSSPQNIGANWPETVAMAPDRAKAPCWPCHRLHYGWATCHMDPASGGSLCTAHLSPDWVWQVIAGLLKPAAQAAE